MPGILQSFIERVSKKCKIAFDKLSCILGRKNCINYHCFGLVAQKSVLLEEEEKATSRFMTRSLQCYTRSVIHTKGEVGKGKVGQKLSGLKTR